MAWQGYYYYYYYYYREPRPGNWEFVQTANGDCCSKEGCHTYTFGGGRLLQEKYRFYAACADGCVKCVQAYLKNSSVDILNSVSNSEKYTAMDYVLFVYLEGRGHDGHRRVIEELKAANVDAKWYVYEGDTWKKRM